MLPRDFSSSPIGRQTLTEQVLAHLRAEIAAGTWKEWLPAERDLAAALRVSRSSLRIALQALRHEGAVQAIRARGNRIRTAAPLLSRAASTSIGLLTPGPLHLHAPFALVWVDHLRAALHAHGLSLVVHERNQPYTQHHPGTPLTQLVERNRHGSWILLLSTAAMQAWFAKAGVPCVLAGSPHEGIKLPTVDVNFFATSRHAATTLLHLGHRRFLFLNEDSRARGYRDSESGFRAGIADFNDDATKLYVRRVAPNERLLPGQLRQYFTRPQRPTAIIVMTAGRCLGVTGCLAQLGLRVPTDVSLICRSAGSFFEHMVPLPAHYQFRPDEYAKVLVRYTVATMNGAVPRRHAHKLMPKFVRGESLAPPPAQPA